MRRELEPMEQAFLLLKNQNERWDEIIREYNERKFDELMAGFHQRYSPNRSLRLTSAQNTSKYHPSKNLHLARKLANRENTSFRDHNLEMGRGEELPLETIMTDEPLGGRFVFPSHAMGLTPRQGSEFVDVPESKRAWPLNLYGFESTPERYGKNQDPEGIIYGDLEEDSVRRLNKNPFMLYDLQRAASMFLPRSKDAPPSRIGLEGAQRHRARELAQMIMDAEIPGALIDPQTARAYGIKSFQDIVPTKIGPDGKVISSITENLNDLTGNIGGGMDPLHGTFQQWERTMGPSGRVAELDETHTSPEQMQLLDDQLTAIPGALKNPTQFYRSEPMDLAMRLLKYQTNLGEHHEDFPSPYGPVVAYHGTTGDDARKIMGGDGLKTHSDNYRTMSTNPSEALSYAIDRSVGHHGGGTHSKPKLLAIRQAAFDQNHPNFIGPSHNFKTAQGQTVDFSDATHYGGNIPRQFLTNTPITNSVLENTAHARTNNQNEINTAMSQPALSIGGQIAQRENTEIDTPNLQQTNQRGEVRPKEPYRMRWGKNREQITDDYNQRMAQYMQPNPVVQPTDPNQQQLPLQQPQVQQPQVQQPQVQQPQVQQPQVQQPQMIQQGEPMDIAMRLLKEFYIGDDEEGMQGFYTPADISNEALLSIPRNQTMNRMSGVDKNTVQEIQNKGDYTTGGSQPRLQSNGDFIGADVRGINDSDESIQGLANTLGHEYTHSLINPEINEWAEQQHGPLQSQVKPEYPTDMQGASFLQRLKTKPTNQAEMDAEKQRVALANQARVYAHEYGAHQSDQSNQTGVNEMLQHRPDTYEYWNHLQSQQPQMIQQGEPMEIAMRLLKERVSPEAKRHKLEYDKKYESSPERVKYREELNRERRQRHIMGQGGPDMSHTSQHTIVPEDPHTNRARHFKDKGTLL
jgi:hypothetical protein